MSEAITQSAAYDLVDRFLRNNLYDDDYAKYSEALEALSQSAPSPQAPGRRKGPPGITLEPQGHEQPAVPVVSDDDLVACLISSGCVGTVKMSFESGPMSITRPSLNATKFARAILALRPAVEPMTGPEVEQNLWPLLRSRGASLSLHDCICVVRAVERHHGITAKAEDAHQPTKAAQNAIAEFDRYFTSANGVDVPERVTVSRDEWRALRAALQDKAGEVADFQSRSMFVARLENMQANGDAWLTVPAVLALLNDCDMIASTHQKGDPV